MCVWFWNHVFHDWCFSVACSWCRPGHVPFLIVAGRQGRVRDHLQHITSSSSASRVVSSYHGAKQAAWSQANKKRVHESENKKRHWQRVHVFC